MAVFQNNVHIDKYDLAIIHFLQQEQHLSKVARTILRSKSFVQYRINNLLNLNVIQNYQALLDYGLLGLHMYIVRIQVKEVNTADLVKFLCKSNIVEEVTLLMSQFNIQVKVYVNFIYVLQKFLKEMCTVFKDAVVAIEFHQVYRSYSSATNFLGIKPIIPTHRSSFQSIVPINISERQKKLVCSLVQEPSTSTVNLAKKLSCSSQTTILELTSLREKKILLSIRPKLNTKLICHRYMALHLEIHPGYLSQLPSISKFLLLQKNLISMDEDVSSLFIYSTLAFMSVDEVEQFNSNLKSVFGSVLVSIHYSDIISSTLNSYFVPALT